MICLDNQIYNLGNPELDWQCDGCSIVTEDGAIVVENRFSEPDHFQLFTEIDLLESQNVRITVELVDYVADLVQVWVPLKLKRS